MIDLQYNLSPDDLAGHGGEGMVETITLTAAQGLAVHGLSVIPVEYGGKRPAIAWKDYQTRRPTDEEVRHWFGNGNDLNIGVVTGVVSGLVVIDADSTEAVEWCEANLPQTPTVKTARGRHYYLKFRAGLKNTVGVGGRKLDIRADGGYVVAPPSVHKTGVIYSWIKGLDLDSLPFADFPPKLLIKPAKEKSSTTGSPGKYGQAALSHELAELTGAVEGERNNHLNRAAFSLGQLAAGGELDQHQVEAALLDVAVSVGLTENEARQTIRSGMDAGSRKPRTAPEPIRRDTQNAAGTTALNTANEVLKGDIFRAAFKGQQGAAALFVRLYSGKFCYDHAAGVWYTWKGHYWKRDQLGEHLSALNNVAALFERGAAHCKSEIITLGQAMADAVGEEQADIKQKIKKLQNQQKVCTCQSNNLNNLGYRKGVIVFAAQGSDSLGVSGEQWDSHPWLLPCPNGVVNLRIGSISPGKSDNYLKTTCPTPYDSDAPAEAWLKALDEIFGGDAELVAFVQRFMGMALVGAALEHVLSVWHGSGRNGKDTILQVIRNVLGDLAGPVQSELLLDQGRTRSSAGPSADIMALRGRRIAWASETNEGRRLDAGRVKLLTGGGDLVGRPPFGRCEVSFPQSHTLFLLTNSKPNVNAGDYALWKRLHLVPFRMAFVDDPQAPNERKADKYLIGKLQQEAPGILAWLVRGCLEWQRQGLNPPKIVREATSDYRDDEDLLLQFVKDCCKISPSAEVGASELYQGYRNWCTDNALKPMSGTAFGREMGERYEKTRTTGGMTYSGLGLLAM